MDPRAVALVLTAALLHAAWNALVKSGGDRLLTLGAVNASRFGVCLLAAPFLPLPAPEAWPFLVASAVLHVGYYLFLLAAYRVGDLSHVYPLARGASPLLILAGAWAFAGEQLPLAQLGGVVLVSAGIVSLTFESRSRLEAGWRPVGFALATAVFIAAYTVTDGMGVRRADAVVSYVVWLTLLDGWPVLAIAVARRRRQSVVSEWRSAVSSGAAGGVFQLLAYGLVVWAMSIAPMAGVSAIRETSVIFAALIGMLVLHEPFTPTRLIAAVLVACGVVVINVA